jgi:mannose-6-phosphate isomerase-like protein (cupin superfamily)
MIIRDIAQGNYFKALDDTLLCELLHPFHEAGDIKIDYSIAHAFLEPGQRSLPHKLKTLSEVYYILEGEGVMTIDLESAAVKAGQVIYIPPASTQSLENTGPGDLKFLCLVHPPWQAAEEEVFEP